MTDMTLPCDAFVRAVKLANNPEFAEIRLEDGLIIATNGMLMMIEKVGDWLGTVNVAIDPAIVAQCEEESKYSGRVTFTHNEMLGFATAKTTFGYVHPTNLVSTQNSQINRWQEIAVKSVDPVNFSVGAMYWKADVVALLASVAPSGGIVFEEMIDINRPIIVRDKDEPNWLGLFVATPKGETVEPATFPTWVKFK